MVQFRRLQKRLGRPKALMAVAHRLAFTVYGIWKTGEKDEEGAKLSPATNGSACIWP